MESGESLSRESHGVGGVMESGELWSREGGGAVGGVERVGKRRGVDGVESRRGALARLVPRLWA